MIRWSLLVECKHFFPRLRCLHLQAFNQLIFSLYGDEVETVFKAGKFFPTGILEKFYFLKKFILENCLSEEMFSRREVKENAFWHCKEIEVLWCHQLKILMPPQSLPFTVLKILKVSGCNEMIRSISISAAKSLIMLENLIIKYCKKNGTNH